MIHVPLAGDGTDAASNQALATLRSQVLPATLGHVGGISYAVTGLTAGNHDFTAQLSSRAPFVFLFVLGLAFLLLLVTFRSIAIPLMSIGLNLLSVAAAYGLLTAGLPGRPPAGSAGLLQLRRGGPLAAAVPVRDPVRPVAWTTTCSS